MDLGLEGPRKRVEELLLQDVGREIGVLVEEPLELASDEARLPMSVVVSVKESAGYYMKFVASPRYSRKALSSSGLMGAP